MFVLKNRILNMIGIIRGPFHINGDPKMDIVHHQFQTGTASQTIRLKEKSDSSDPFEAGNPDFLPIKMRYFDGRLNLELPAHSTLKRAKLWGWETIWNGVQAILSPEMLKPSMQGTFQVSIPAQGLWKVSALSCSTEFFICHPLLTQEKRNTFKNSKEWFRSLGYFSSAFLGHASLAFLIFLISHGTFHSLSEWIETSVPIDQQSQEAQAESAQAPIEMAPDDDSGFNGRSIFVALNPPKAEEAPEPVKDPGVTLGSKLKNLSQLIKMPSSANLKAALNPGVKKAGGTSSSQFLSSSLNALRSKLGNSPKTQEPAISTQNTGPKVAWVPQFLSGKNQSQTLNESQRKQLLEAFSKLQDRFRDCYESALLKYDELSVTVTFEGEINQEGRIQKHQFNYSGRSTSESKESLTSCLKKIMDRIQVDRKNSGIKISNQFIFKS